MSFHSDCTSNCFCMLCDEGFSHVTLKQGNAMLCFRCHRTYDISMQYAHSSIDQDQGVEEDIPAAACRRAAVPGATCMAWLKARSAVMKTVGMVDACSKVTVRGTGTSRELSASTCEAMEPATCPNTAWPAAIASAYMLDKESMQNFCECGWVNAYRRLHANLSPL